MTPEMMNTPAPEQPATTEVARPKERSSLEMMRILATNDKYRDLLSQIVEAETMRDVFDQDYRTAKVFAMSGQFDDLKNQTTEQAIATAMAKIRIGRGWGMSDSDSIAYIYFVNGRPAVMSEMLASKMMEVGFSWDVEWHEETVQMKNRPYKKCIGCTLWLKRKTNNHYEPVVNRQGEQACSSFTDIDAEAAGLFDKRGSVWKAWTRNMYFWRALGNLRRFYVTGVLRGAVQAELANDYSVEVDKTPQIEAPREPAEQSKSLRDQVIEAEQADLLEP